MATGPRRDFLVALALAAAFAVVGAAPALAGGTVARDEHTEVALIAERPGIVPGTPIEVGLRIRPIPGWHVYWKQVGDAGEPPTVEWRLPPGFSAAPFEWPAPYVKFRLAGGVTTIGYDREVTLLTRIEVPPRLDGESTEIAAHVEWLVCDKDGCVPGSADLSLRLPVTAVLPGPDPAAKSAFDSAHAALPRAPAAPARAWLEGTSLAVEVPAEDTKPGPADVFPDPPDGFDIAAFPTVVRGAIAGAERIVVRLPLAKKRKDVPARFQGVVTSGPAAASRAWAVDVPVAPSPPADALPAPALSARPSPAGSSDDGGPSFALALLLAFAGGIALNLMPCVLPVLAVKVLGFVEQAGQNPRRVRIHGIAFGAGVLASFWALAGLLLVLRAAGQGIGWGFQLQEPSVVAILALLLFAVGLNLLGVFEVGTALSSWAGAAAGSGRAAGKGPAGYAASWWNGMLATVIATPCTAPFMGPAVGYALVSPPAASIAVFTSLGLGMAAPYVVLSEFPHWLRWIPKPGPWMVTFRQAMAFPVFATVIWLAWVFSRQTGGDGMALLWVAALCLAVASWLHGRFGGVHRGAAVRWIAGRGLAAVALAATAYAAAAGSGKVGPPPLPPVGWERWSEERVAAELTAGRTVFVDFTADWCATCKANDVAVLSTGTVDDAVRQHGVVLLQADWTRKDPAIAKALASFGRSSVPLYVVYSPVPGAAPEVLPTTITPGMVADALSRASSPARP